MKSSELPYRSLSRTLVERFGKKVHRVPLDAGFGCPNRDGTLGTGGCTFCDHGIGLASPDGSPPPPIVEQMRVGMRRVRARTGARAFLAYFQRGTGTYGPADRVRTLVREALVSPEVVGVSVATRPDCVGEPILDALQEGAGDRPLWIELGLPSAREATLALVRRGHGLEAFREAAERIRRRRIALCAHVVFFLPGETREDMLATLEVMTAAGVEGIKIHNLYVVRGTEIARAYLAGELALPSLDEYAGVVADAIERLPPDVVIHRLTGEGPRERVLAPEWCFEKGRAIERIREILRVRGSRQGSARGGSVAHAVGGA